jgi:hypothetical protein
MFELDPEVRPYFVIGCPAGQPIERAAIVDDQIEILSDLVRPCGLGLVASDRPDIDERPGIQHGELREVLGDPPEQLEAHDREEPERLLAGQSKLGLPARGDPFGGLGQAREEHGQVRRSPYARHRVVGTELDLEDIDAIGAEPCEDRAKLPGSSEPGSCGTTDESGELSR